MNILLVGSGGREHAIAWKIAQSNKLSKLYIAPGNAGTALCGQNIDADVNNFEQLANIAVEKNVQMLVCGPEEPLVRGLHDYFAARQELQHIAVIGPKSFGAQLEGSKDFAKQFMLRNNIPTARYLSVTANTLQQGLAFLDTLQAPFVLKADGLAAGKGVLILHNRDEARRELQQMLEGKFGTASRTVVVEEFLNGIELSAFAITDGVSYCMLPAAKDYKRIGEADTGLNTGGMGAVSPVPFADADFMQKVEQRVVIPTVEGLKREKIDYQGFLFFGLMNVGGDPYVIEYNCRMGDPETEVVIPRITNDIIEVFDAVAQRRLSQIQLHISPKTFVTVMMVSGGYPEDYKKGFTINGLTNVTDATVFHAGTKISNNQVITSGGRVLAVTAYGNNKTEALQKAYRNAQHITFDGAYYRRDIGFDV